MIASKLFWHSGWTSARENPSGGAHVCCIRIPPQVMMGIWRLVRPKRRVGHLKVELVVVFMLSKEEEREVVEWREEVRLTSKAAVVVVAAPATAVGVVSVVPARGVVHCSLSDEEEEEEEERRIALVKALTRSSVVAMVPRDAWCAKADLRFWKRSNCLAWWPSSCWRP